MIDFTHYVLYAVIGIFSWMRKGRELQPPVKGAFYWERLE